MNFKKKVKNKKLIFLVIDEYLKILKHLLKFKIF